MAVPPASMNNEGSTAAPERLGFAGFTLDLAGHTLVDANGQDVPLRRLEFALLLALVRRSGRVQSRDQLLEAAAGRSQEPFDRSIDVMIGRLRKKLEPDPKAPRLIVTVSGTGYKFAGRVQAVQNDDGPELVEAEKDQGAEPRPPERRQLTVMLCGIATPFSRRLDPEDLHRLVTIFHKACTDVITRCGGVVGQLRPDGVLAYFGYPQAHEHDAEYAVRAGLGVIEATAKLETGLPAASAVRVAIATGSVIAGDLLGEAAAAAHAVLGEAPDLAARLLASAAPGSVVIAVSTRRLVGRLFDCRALDPVAQEEDGEPLGALQVLGEAAVESRFEALREGGLSRLVGREEEVALLLRRWTRAREGAGRVVHISGEPGMGKSRLVRELRVRLDDEAHRFISYFCAPHHQNTPLHPIIAQLERAAGFARENAPDEKLAKLEALLKPSGVSGTDLALIADLLSIPTSGRYPQLDLSPRQRRQRTSQALIAQLLGAARERPVLLVFEDLHWIDPTSREVLETLVERISDKKILVVTTARPEFVATWPSQVPAETVLLHRLDDRDVMEMIADVEERRLPATLCRQIVKRADGVPLFAEELAKMVESGLMRDIATQVASSTASLELPLPESLHDLLMARLDRVPAAKEVAQLGAVIGRSFSHELIAAVAQVAEPTLRDGLQQLVGSGLAFQRGTPPDASYTFKHALVQETVYQSLLRSRRAALHGRVAEVLRAQAPEIERTEPALLAHHYEQAGLSEQAIDYYLKAGKLAFARSANAEAITQLQKGLYLLDRLSDDQRRRGKELDLQVVLGCAFVAARGNASPEAERTYSRARELCRLTGETSSLVSVLCGIWVVHLNRAELALSVDVGSELLSCHKNSGDILAEALGHSCTAMSRVFQGALTAARTHSAQALASYEATPRVFETRAKEIRDSGTTNPLFELAFVGRTRSSLSWALLLEGYLDQALSERRIALIEAPKSQHPFGSASILHQSCIFHQMLGNLDEVEQHSAALLALLAEHDLSPWLGAATINHGWCMVVGGERTAGLAEMRRGLVVKQATGNQLHVPYYLGIIASLLGEGATHEAMPLLVDALTRVEKTGERWFEAELHRLLGELLWSSNALIDDAEISFQRALAVAREQGAKFWELRAAMSLARLWCMQDRCREAVALLAPVYDWFNEGLDTSDLKNAKALLDQLVTASGPGSPRHSWME